MSEQRTTPTLTQVQSQQTQIVTIVIQRDLFIRIWPFFLWAIVYDLSLEIQIKRQKQHFV